MHYKTIYEIASKPLDVLMQWLTNIQHLSTYEKILLPIAWVTIIALLVVVITTLMYVGIKSFFSNLPDLWIGLFCALGDFIAVAAIVAFCFAQHMELANAYINGKAEVIEGVISECVKGISYARNCYATAHIKINNRAIDIYTHDGGFNDPMNKAIKYGTKVRIWLITNPHTGKTAIVRLDVAA